jgi:hypothetical protein
VTQTSSPAPQAPVKIQGKVVCADKSPVKGIWVEAYFGIGSGWAVWDEENKDGGPVNETWFTHELILDAPISFHVGCGGTQKDWATESWSPMTPLGAGRTFTVICTPKTPGLNLDACEVS